MRLDEITADKGGTNLKHFRPFRSVFESTRYCGSLIYSPRGWQAHDAAGKRIGEYADEDQAVKRLRGLAQRLST